MAYQVDDL